MIETVNITDKVNSYSKKPDAIIRSIMKRNCFYGRVVGKLIINYEELVPFSKRSVLHQDLQNKWNMIIQKFGGEHTQYIISFNCESIYALFHAIQYIREISKFRKKTIKNIKIQFCLISSLRFEKNDELQEYNDFLEHLDNETKIYNPFTGSINAKIEIEYEKEDKIKHILKFEYYETIYNLLNELEMIRCRSKIKKIDLVLYDLDDSRVRKFKFT